VWPGRLPSPAPAIVHTTPVAAALLDRDGCPVGVNGRGAVSSPPHRLSLEGGPWTAIAAWTGPWPADEWWWDTAAHRRRARLQVLTVDATAFLLSLESGRWWVEATYD
jgi:protein ImuB